MTTNDKRPRRTTKTAKTVKAPDTAGASDSPAMSGTTKAVDAAKTADAVKTANAAKVARPAKAPSASGPMKTPALDKVPRTDTAPVAGISRAENGGLPASAPGTGTRRIRSISVSVTSRYHEDRHASIALAAYFRSESRGFAPGHEVEDWLAAEEEVDQRLLGEGRAS